MSTNLLAGLVVTVFAVTAAQAGPTLDAIKLSNICSIHDQLLT